MIVGHVGPKNLRRVIATLDWSPEDQNGRSHIAVNDDKFGIAIYDGNDYHHIRTIQRAHKDTIHGLKFIPAAPAKPHESGFGKATANGPVSFLLQEFNLNSIQSALESMAICTISIDLLDLASEDWADIGVHRDVAIRLRNRVEDILKLPRTYGLNRRDDSIDAGHLNEL